MSPKDAKQIASEVRQFFSRDAVTIVGVLAKNHFKESFETDKQGFTDEQLEKWQELKPATLKAKTRRNGSAPPILTDKGHLSDSIDYNADFNAQQVIMSSDLPYAQVHNEGGGPKNMPKRQFMGPSKKLEEKILAKFEKQLDKIFNG